MNNEQKAAIRRVIHAPVRKPPEDNPAAVAVRSAAENGILFVQLCARRGAVKLEAIGMKRHGQSAYSICKSVYGLRGSKEAVLRQLNEMIQAVHSAREGRPE